MVPAIITPDEEVGHVNYREQFCPGLTGRIEMSVIRILREQWKIHAGRTEMGSAENGV
jgi:hypothetical protein